MGNIKTKKRNRLSMKKTRDCAFIKGEVRREHAKQGTARQRLKRQFGNKGTAPLDVDPTGSRLEEEEFLKEIDDDTQSDGDSDDGLPESIVPSQNNLNTSRVLLVARQLMQATDDDSDGSDVGEEPLVTPMAGTSKVSAYAANRLRPMIHLPS